MFEVGRGGRGVLLRPNFANPCSYVMSMTLELALIGLLISGGEITESKLELGGCGCGFGAR